jgi:hypothetical protein
MMSQSIFVEPLREADAFQKNVFVLFNDIVATIKVKALTSTIFDRQTESYFEVWSSQSSEHRHLYIFELNGKLRFIYFVVKANDDLLRGRSAQYVTRGHLGCGHDSAQIVRLVRTNRQLKLRASILCVATAETIRLPGDRRCSKRNRLSARYVPSRAARHV